MLELLLLAAGYFTTHSPSSVPGHRQTKEMGVAAEACQQMQDQKASPFPPVISLDGSKISFKTNKSDSSSLNEEMGELRTL